MLRERVCVRERVWEREYKEESKDSKKVREWKLKALKIIKQREREEGKDRKRWESEN